MIVASQAVVPFVPNTLQNILESIGKRLPSVVGREALSSLLLLHANAVNLTVRLR